jgi:hypothetical protein
LGWNPQGARRKERPKQNSKRTVLEDARKWGKTWSEVRSLVGNRLRLRSFTNALCS